MTDKRSHTAGPWSTTEYVERTNRKVSYIWGQQVSTIATVENGPREANARLIAAAPELLESCRELVEGFGFAVQGGLTAKLIERARAAIAKAEGTAEG